MSVTPPRPRGPHLNAMRSFEAAARLGGFSAAAEELCVTPGAVSQQVRALEAELGVSLVRQAEQITIDNHAVSYTNLRQQRRSVAADHVIVARGASGNPLLKEQLETAGLKVHSVGDCNGILLLQNGRWG